MVPGAVWAERAVLTRCSFIENAGVAGALYGSDILVESCQFTRNYGSSIGGGAAHVRRSTFTKCTFAENRTPGDGGALYLYGSPSEGDRLVGCVFRRNSARSGGAIVFDGDLEVSDCLFTANEAGTLGGAGVHRGGHTTLTNCVFAGNRSDDRGAAWVSGTRGSLEIRNCTFSANYSEKGCYLAIDSLPRVVISNSILSGETLGVWGEQSSIQIAYSCVYPAHRCLKRPKQLGGVGSREHAADPCFADPAIGIRMERRDDIPNDDFFVEGDYHLKSQAGRWDLASESWVRQDDVAAMSSTQDDPNCPVGEEPAPKWRGLPQSPERCFGGTAEASKSLSLLNSPDECTHENTVAGIPAVRRDTASRRRDYPFHGGPGGHFVSDIGLSRTNSWSPSRRR